MSSTILITADDQETRAALMESGRLMDFEVEREERIIGNIYKGRVANVLAGMDAAFVDIGLARNAFLYVTDVTPANGDDDFEDTPEPLFDSIKQALHVGQEVVVQVARPGVGTKGPRVTTRLSLPGRYCVLLVRGNQQTGVSRRIASEDERRRLQKIAERIRPLDFGLIVRTEAEGQSEREILSDVHRLVATWKQVEKLAGEAREPGLLHRDLGLVGRIARDWLNASVQSIIVDTETLMDQLSQIVRAQAPEFVARIRLDTALPPLFERHGVDAEVHHALEPTVTLPSGGTIRIDETEALTAIDVNTGRYVGKTKLAETVANTNLEAAVEIARQLRLRDLGGIIVIDFIDMDRNRDRVRVMDELEGALRTDRARTRIVNLSPLGLVEMTRRREGRSLSQTLHGACPTCHGVGHIKSAPTMTMETRRAIRRLARNSPPGAALVILNAECAATFVGAEGESVRALEQEVGRQIHVRVDRAMSQEASVIRLPAADLPADELQPGQTVTVRCRGGIHPHDSRLFAVFDHTLIQLPEQYDQRAETIAIQVRRVHRWFAESP